MTMEIFKTWRAELLAELAEARIAVAEAKAELAAAMEASRVASIEGIRWPSRWRDLRHIG